MKIQDYIPYYIGAQMTRKGFFGKLIAVNYDGSFRVTCSDWWEDAIGDDPYKLILRPLASLTLNESINISSTTENGITWYTPHSIVALCKMGFDMFGLIDAGMALDATKLTTTVK